MQPNGHFLEQSKYKMVRSMPIKRPLLTNCSFVYATEMKLNEVRGM